MNSPFLNSSISHNSTKTEKYYLAILHASFFAAGFEVHSEGTCAHGRNDITLFLNNNVRVVIELKYCRPAKSIKMDSNTVNPDKAHTDSNIAAKEISVALDRAEKQIRKQDYAGPYRSANCKVLCLALALRGRDQVGVRFFDY
ncbi:MAG: PD-(D/E)XK nuclease domain-containing protein [Deltaproteobacteria bacterium]|jgi:hypothetical protein|nr:PD-(D/E)XK nuclease domain-containing protein [Deltaproteobacteria bacterium]